MLLPLPLPLPLLSCYFTAGTFKGIIFLITFILGKVLSYFISCTFKLCCCLDFLFKCQIKCKNSNSSCIMVQSLYEGIHVIAGFFDLWVMNLSCSAYSIVSAVYSSGAGGTYRQLSALAHGVISLCSPAHEELHWQVTFGSESTHSHSSQGKRS